MKNRWVVLAAGVLLETVLGSIYAWSTFVPYLTNRYALSASQCGFIFGFTILMFTSTMVLAGRVIVKKGPRFTAGISAVLFMGGYLLASVSRGEFFLLLLSLGVVAGAGIGFGYVCPLSVGMKWFPNKKGLVTGVAVAGFGGGAILLSSVAEYFLSGGMDVLLLFRWIGIFSVPVLLTAAFFISYPPSLKSESIKRYGLSAVFTMPFGIFALGIFAGTFAGLLIIGNLTSLAINVGLTESQAVASVSIFAVGNALGRIIWGQAFDHFGYRCIPLSLVSFALLAIFLTGAQSSGTLFFVVGLLGICFGANFVVYASAVSRYFGTEPFQQIYPICFLAYGLAGVIGPGVGGYLADLTGSYDTAVYLCIALVLTVGAVSYVKLPIFETTVPGAPVI